jgi:hypothetical protein
VKEVESILTRVLFADCYRNTEDPERTTHAMRLIRAKDRVRILAWYDHPGLVAARRPGAHFVGTIIHVREVAGSVTLSVEVDGVEGTFAFRPGDVEPATEPSIRQGLHRLEPFETESSG